MILLLESDADRIQTLLVELCDFTGWDEARLLLDRLALARAGYPEPAPGITNSTGPLPEPVPRICLYHHLALNSAVTNALSHVAPSHHATNAHIEGDTVLKRKAADPQVQAKGEGCSNTSGSGDSSADPVEGPPDGQ